jgi:hypothetical protein
LPYWLVPKIQSRAGGHSQKTWGGAVNSTGKRPLSISQFELTPSLELHCNVFSSRKKSKPEFKFVPGWGT